MNRTPGRVHHVDDDFELLCTPLTNFSKGVDGFCILQESAKCSTIPATVRYQASYEVESPPPESLGCHSPHRAASYDGYARKLSTTAAPKKSLARSSEEVPSVRRFVGGAAKRDRSALGSPGMLLHEMELLSISSVAVRKRLDFEDSARQVDCSSRQDPVGGRCLHHAVGGSSTDDIHVLWRSKRNRSERCSED